ncbi:hypothetical protein F4802DRAFT_533273 [Xylaria palmicola]|nr:hypothetical protein F4802DRAFT_533273 [Xylaria palmicola]
MLALALFVVLLATPVLTQRCPAVCVSEPPLLLDAGASNVSAIIDGSFGRQCQATLYFSDPMFLPLTYHFDNISCDGLAVTTFSMPEGLPNGDGCVVWQCDGPELVTCNNMIVSGGSSKDTLPRNRSGTIGCMLNTTQVQNPVVTATTSSRTFTKVATSTMTTLSTSIVRGSSSFGEETTAYWEPSQHLSPTAEPNSHGSGALTHTASGSTSGQYPSFSRGLNSSLVATNFTSVS